MGEMRGCFPFGFAQGQDGEQLPLQKQLQKQIPFGDDN